MKIVKTILSFAVLFFAVPMEGATVTLTGDTGEVTLQDNDVLTGTGGSETHVTIATNATVTLRDVDITAIANGKYWSGITCANNATIVLEGVNAVKGGYEDYSGIYVPTNCTLTIKGDGSLNASSNGPAAGIGGGYYIECGNIVIEGGTITATGGNMAAGIGGSFEASCGSISIHGGTVTATGGQYAPGIGGSFEATCGNIEIKGGDTTVIATGGEYAPGIGSGTGSECADITISGGTVIATGGKDAPGIGSGSDAEGNAFGGVCGNIVIEESVTCVTANGGDNAPSSIGAGSGGVCGTVTVAGVVQAGGITTDPYIYNPCVTNITSAADWDAFASRVSRGVDAYKGKTVTLAADISVSTMVGKTESNIPYPFSGTFDGGGHTLTVSLSTSGAVAPFSAVSGATIRNLNVSGTVDGGRHSAGLVGTCSGNGVLDSISNCTVSVAVAVTDYAGGIVGHGGNDKQMLIRNCVFSGSISGFANHAGGILGWCDTIRLTIDNCLMKGAFSGSGKYHPVACKDGQGVVAATVVRAYYLNALEPTTSGNNIIPGAAGVAVNASYVPYEWVYEVTAVDGLAYYTAAHVITLTGTTGEVLLHDGYVLKGTGGALTRVTIDSGASVLLRGVTIPGDASTAKVGITCAGDAVINFDGANTVNGGGGSPAIQVPDGSTLVIKGAGRLDVASSGAADAIVGAVDIDDGLINISDDGYSFIPGMKISEDESNAAIIARHDGRSETVWLSGRTFRSDGSWSTLCLPFSMSAAEIAASPLAGVIIKEWDSASTRVTTDGLELNFTNVTEIVAGRPYVVRWAPALVIRTTEDWNAFARSVTSRTASYEGRLVQLGADIEVSTMAGATGINNPFRGIFDGCGHTITANLAGSGEGTALFYHLKGATIQNLKVNGTVTTTGHRPAAITSFVEGTCRIQNCWVSAAVSSTLSDSQASNIWVDGGALVGRVDANSTVHITDCAFTGSISYKFTEGGQYGGSSGGGMVGKTQARATAYLTNCLFMPSSVSIEAQNAKAYVFVSGEVRGNLTNCYYNDAAASSPLNKEGTHIFSGIYPAILAQRLGDNWEVCGSFAVPKMNAPCDVDYTIERPMFNAVTVSAATANVKADLADFVGSTSPMTLAAGSRSALTIEADGTLAFANAGATIGSCRAYFRLNGQGALQNVTRYVLNYGEETVTGEFGHSSSNGYGLWAAQNGIAGAWNETDASGVCNVFRYAFDKPSGAFTDTPLLAITIENGNAVIHTPPLVNTDGFAFSIVATDALGAAAADEYPVNPSGRTVIPVANKPARFFRLRAAEE